MRLSVSALRDYTFCGEYYRLKRVAKFAPSDGMTHHRAAGKIVHSAYYYAHANPVLVEQEGRHNQVKWELTGAFDPARARAMFWTLWNRDDTGLQGEEHEHYLALIDDLPPWREVNFTKGLTKALKAESQAERRAGWGEHYAAMLDEALSVPLPGKLVEIERAVDYEVGGVSMLGYIDLVVELEDGTEGFLDLKSSWNKPAEDKLPYDLQQQLYFLSGASRIWLWYMRHGLFEVPRNFTFIDALTRSVPMTAEAIKVGFFRPRCDSECAGCEFLHACMPETP